MPPQRIDRILVLGGGSAGFMAALALKRQMPDLKVRILRSGQVGIIGVGEGSNVGLTAFLHGYLKLNPRKFHAAAQPTWKLGLKFLWGPRPYFNYSFGPGLDGIEDGLPRPNGFYCQESIEYTDLHSALMTEDRAFLNDKGRPAFHGYFAYHFENEKFVDFLESWARALNIEIVEDHVEEVLQDENGISGLRLTSGQTAEADLFVDCSGFASVLLGKALQEPFVSFRSSLFCERALVGGWNRSGPEDQTIRPYTTCETMESGWSWQIEHEFRVNRGYVYCPAFVSDDQAETEFRAANPKLGALRIVPFQTGRYERSWVKNVVAIGNASGFVEPLEATALSAIAQQSRGLADTLFYSDRQLQPSHFTAANRWHGCYWDAIRRFLAIHYKFNHRIDSPFWRQCQHDTDLAGAEDICEYYRENGPDGYWGVTLLNNPHDQFRISGYMTLLAGMKVPHRQIHTPSDRDRELFRQRQAKYRKLASGGLSVAETLAAIRSPKWSWA